jgi:hypothetical protein
MEFIKVTFSTDDIAKDTPGSDWGFIVRDGNPTAGLVHCFMVRDVKLQLKAKENLTCVVFYNSFLLLYTCQILITLLPM